MGKAEEWCVCEVRDLRMAGRTQSRVRWGGVGRSGAGWGVIREEGGGAEGRDEVPCHV